MESMADFKDRFLRNSPICKYCKAQMKFDFEMLVFPSKERPLPDKYILFFKCPDCGAVTSAIFHIKKIDLRAISSSFLNLFSCLFFL